MPTRDATMFGADPSHSCFWDFSHPVTRPTILWSARIGASYATPLLHQRLVLTLTLEPSTAHYGAWLVSSGESLWKIPVVSLPPCHYHTPCISGEMAYLFLHGKLVEVRVDTGAQTRELVFDKHWSPTTSALCSHRTLYVGSNSNEFVSVSLEKLTLNWKHRGVAGAIYSTPAADDATVFYAVCGVKHGTVYGVDRETGETVWNTELGTNDVVRSSPSLLGDLLVLSAGYTGDVVYGLDKRSGRIRWRRDFTHSNGDPDPWKPLLNLGNIAATPDALIVHTSVSGILRSLDEEGHETGIARLGAPIEGPPVVLQNVTYCITTTGKLVAFAHRDGFAWIWTHDFGQRVANSVAVDQRHIVIATVDGSLTCMHWEMGVEVSGATSEN